jgi:hypothetical protein
VPDEVETGHVMEQGDNKAWQEDGVGECNMGGPR